MPTGPEWWEVWQLLMRVACLVILIFAPVWTRPAPSKLELRFSRNEAKPFWCGFDEISIFVTEAKLKSLGIRPEFLYSDLNTQLEEARVARLARVERGQQHGSKTE